MSIITAFLARSSVAQFTALVLLMSGAALLFAFRPVSIEQTGTEAGARGALTATQLQYSDLASAVDLLRESGFIISNEGNAETLAGRAIIDGGNRDTASGPDRALPKVIAIVRSGGRWSAYLKQNSILQISNVGETVGVWQIDHISQGEIRLSYEDAIEIIDIFGASADATGEE